MDSFYCSIGFPENIEEKEVEDQFKEAEEYRKQHCSSFERIRQLTTTHPQAIYTSRLLNHYTEGLVCDFSKFSK
jgi:hypothetical protein